MTSPKATPSARRCGSGSRFTPGRRGDSSWWTEAKANAISDSTAIVRTICMPPACFTVWPSSADFPTPGSPRRTSALLIPRRTPSRTACSAFFSDSRPINCTPTTVALIATARQCGGHVVAAPDVVSLLLRCFAAHACIALGAVAVAVACSGCGMRSLWVATDGAPEVGRVVGEGLRVA